MQYYSCPDKYILQFSQSFLILTWFFFKEFQCKTLSPFSIRYFSENSEQLFHIIIFLSFCFMLIVFFLWKKSSLNVCVLVARIYFHLKIIINRTFFIFKSSQLKIHFDINWKKNSCLSLNLKLVLKMVSIMYVEPWPF